VKRRAALAALGAIATTALPATVPAQARPPPN